MIDYTTWETHALPPVVCSTMGNPLFFAPNHLGLASTSASDPDAALKNRS